MQDVTRDVVIPAGGSIDEGYARAIGSPFRALAPLGPDRVPVLQHVVDTLRASGAAGRIIVVAPSPVADVIEGVDEWLLAGDSGPANIRAGLARATPGRAALVCASDLPLMTPKGVADFCVRCRPNAQIAVGMVAAEDYNRAFPDAPPSEFVRLADAGEVTLGGLFLIHPDLLARHDALLRRLFAGRKDQWRMAGVLGPRLLWQWATKTLRLETVTRRAETISGTPVDVVSETDPTLAYDIDTEDDYTYAQSRFGQPTRPPRGRFSA
jgi:hypothetical protein